MCSNEKRSRGGPPMLSSQFRRQRPFTSPGVSMCSISMCSSRYRNQASLLEVRMGSVFTGRYRGFRRDVADGGRVRTGLVRRGRLLARPSASRSSQGDRPIQSRRGEGKVMFGTWMCLSMQTDARSITSRKYERRDSRVRVNQNSLQFNYCPPCRWLGQFRSRVNVRKVQLLYLCLH